MKTNLYLMGFMGAGKTTVGRLLAQACNLPFFDLDEEIVTHVGKTIPEIFAEEGEPAFRAHEAHVLTLIPGPAVVSLGGGAPCTEAVEVYMGQSGRTIYLRWPLETLLARVAGDPSRPLAGDPEKMKVLYEAREPVYSRAHLIWSPSVTASTNPADIVSWIESQLECLPGK